LADKVSGGIERGQAKAREITGKAKRIADQAGQVADQAKRVVDQAKGQVQRVQDAVDAGVRAFKGEKSS
jgi:methyl-accepting chemotaxis protein